jgi:Ca-activated chloride channel family protein
VSFAHPHLLWSLQLVVPGLIAFFWWAWQKKQELIARFISARLLPQLTVGVAPARQKARVALLVAAVTLLVIVLARPQIGFSWEEARSRGLDIVIAIDTSRSMLATDVAPNRLRRAQLAALDLKRVARTDRLGLVAFAGSAFLQCPLTLDDEAFRQSVEALDVNIIPQGGTAIAEAILAAKGAFKEGNDNHKVVVLFTDGEDHDGNGVEVAKQAAKDGLTIFTVGVGTPGGELLRTVDVQGRTEFIKDPDGNAVKSRLNEDLLRDIARETGGYFMLLSGAKAMDLLYENRLAPLPKGDLASQRIKRPHERYQWLLGLVLVLLVIELLFPERKPAPKTNAEPTASTAPAAASTAPVRQGGAGSPAVAAPRAKLVASILLLFAFVFLPRPARASSSEGLKQYQKGRYDRAVMEYESALRKQPDDPRLHFNAGTAAFQNKDYDQAVSHLNSALLTQELPLQHRTYYNLGNTQFRQGQDAPELDKRRQLWEQAIRSYDSAVSLNAKDADAQFNRELVKQKLEELKQQQQQQKQQQQGDKNKDGQQDKNKQDSKDQQQQQDQSKKQDGKDQQKQDQQKQQQQDQQAKNQQQQEEQKKKEQQSKDGQQSQQGKQDKDGQEKNAQQAQQDQGDQGDQQDGTPARAVRMTPQQAVQLLEALKGEERVMTFRPLRTNRQDRVFKDW